MCFDDTDFFLYSLVGLDFGGGPFTASFFAGFSATSVTVPIVDDRLREDNETFTAQLQIPIDIQDLIVGGANTDSQAIIKDNEVDIIVKFNLAQYEVSEDGQFVLLTLIASHPAIVPYFITVSTMDGAAQGITWLKLKQ